MGQNPLEERTKSLFNRYTQNVGHTKHLLFELAGISFGRCSTISISFIGTHFNYRPVIQLSPCPRQF